MSGEDAYTPYGERPEWNDVQPISQQDARDGLVPIAYSREYSDAMDYFRAIASAQEYSERALDLTEHIIRRNPAHYTVWQYRMSTLLALQKDLQQELQLMNEFAEENLKSYQVWHHRLTLITHMEPQLAELTKEIEFIHDSLMPDPKNYHTWAYLNWLYSSFSNLPEERGGDRFYSQSWNAELEWCERMLDSNHRFLRARSLEDQDRQSEKIQSLSDDDDERGEVIGRGDGRNNSAWNWRWYLVITRRGAKPDVGTELDTIPAPSVISSIPSNPPPVITPANPDTPLPVPFAIEWLADCKAELAAATESIDVYTAAAGLYHELAERWDVMRKTYWRFRQSEMQRQASNLNNMESTATATE
ncbi:hypothetical protein QFC21_000320 [Naganishia friedmannii]|uniref:Uncharacterized protein n=1 Tax=Naganishia friedmannii TaxID=89922 RepID=A0ACC2WCN9_9TREE|nr:hypothetical protein QFC21_000320 [Naganishia friedmannii]